MKKGLKWFLIVLSVLVGICVLLVLAALCLLAYEKARNNKLYEQRVELLRSAGAYQKDTNAVSIRIIHDTLRAREIRDYFQLDTLYTPDADTWTKARAIGRFVTSHIPHDNQKEWPVRVNAIGLWEYTKDVAPAFNCRLHSILTFELLLSAGLDAKYITCMPADPEDTDCHVVNEVWLPELEKWAMVDTDMNHYITGTDGVQLSLKEIREHYIAGEEMVIYNLLEDSIEENASYYRAYMAKNTYWFSCWGELSYYIEDHTVEDVVRDHYYHLVPSGFEPFSNNGKSVATSDDEQFWASPASK